MENESDFRKLLKSIAENEGTSPESVLIEIETALAAARSDPDPALQALWAAIPHKGKWPTAEEVVGFIAAKVR